MQQWFPRHRDPIIRAESPQAARSQLAVGVQDIDFLRTGEFENRIVEVGESGRGLVRKHVAHFLHGDGFVDDKGMQLLRHAIEKLHPHLFRFEFLEAKQS